ncbi:MAG: precorrin-6y C5,15-methyltransferase (decarboxylating) subunit CbiE [Maritimibacter sp.]
MKTPWLHIIGIGEDGLEGLNPISRAVINDAQVIIGGARHHELTKASSAKRIAWPSPFDTLLETLRDLQGQRVVVLATGDPLWFSVGARLGREIDPDQITYHPHVSAFQLASARMGWSMADLDALTVHGRPTEQMIPFIQPSARLLILTTGSETPAEIARLLTDRGYGESRITVLAHMGGADEARFEGKAATWNHAVPAFNTLALECIAAPDAALLPRTPGLPDAAFANDGTMTKRDVRAATLAKLMPMRGALLWDIGTGSGAVAVEWMRAARDARAIGIEARADRRALAAQNAQSLGTPGLHLVAGKAPKALADLEAPDAVFIGGGLSRDTFETAYQALKPLGRLVANAVTLDSQALLFTLFERHGGELVQINISRATEIGPRLGWRPSMPVTQWSLIKR